MLDHCSNVVLILEILILRSSSYRSISPAADQGTRAERLARDLANEKRRDRAEAEVDRERRAEARSAKARPARAAAKRAAAEERKCTSLPFLKFCYVALCCIFQIINKVRG